MTLQENLLFEINSKRGCLFKSQACQILLRAGLDLVHGTLIPNIVGEQVYE